METRGIVIFAEMVYNIFCAGIVAQLVRALPCHGRGREFESRRFRHFLFHKKLKKRDSDLRLRLRCESRRFWLDGAGGVEEHGADKGDAEREAYKD